MSAFISLIQHGTGSPIHSNQTSGNKVIKIGREKLKLSLFPDDIILYRENPKGYTKKLLELINEFSKVAGCKINTQKLVAFLYANNELIEMEIKKTILFTIASKIIKYLGIT